MDGDSLGGRVEHAVASGHQVPGVDDDSAADVVARKGTEGQPCHVCCLVSVRDRLAADYSRDELLVDHFAL